MKEDINNIRNEFIAQIVSVSSPEDIESLRVAYLGRNGKLTTLIREMKDLEPSEKKQMGQLLNEAKLMLLQRIEEETKRIKNSKKEQIDPTIPGEKVQIGHTHLVSQAIQDIERIFSRIGFIRMRYPEVEWDFYAFESLNFPPHHPARDEWETFWVDTSVHKDFGPMLLTPHTSSGQVREMERVRSALPAGSQAPIRMINIAKCYRRQSDVSHTPMFHQFEGLVVDKDISIAHLKGTLDYFAHSYFGATRKTRLRPYDFVFTEPSFEVDISCDICDGAGRLKNGEKCRLCKEGWLEIGGAGMVHPNVLKYGGIDPKKHSGFAFGWGVERVLMMRSGLKIDDLRTLYSSDLRFLTQF